MATKNSKELEFEFNALPESVRERFVQCVSGNGQPAPIFATTSPPRWALALFALIGIGGLGFAWISDFSQNIQEPIWMLLYVGAAWMVALTVVLAAATAVRRRALPYEFGVYVFPLDVVYARGPRLRVVPISSLTNFQATHHSTNGSYTNTSFDFVFEGGAKETFTVRGKDEADKNLAEFRRTQQAIAQAADQQRFDLFAGFDPFFEVRSGDGMTSLVRDQRVIRPHGKHVAEEVPRYLERGWLTALAIALVLGPSLWYARNWASDGAYYAFLVHYESQYSARSYLTSGATRYVEEVRSLVPKFTFQDAKRSSSLPAMRRFVAEFPDSEYVPEARELIHSRYLEAEEVFRQRAPKDDPRLLDFMHRLFQYLELNDSPKVAVRFRPPANEALLEVDESLRDAPREHGTPPVSPVSPSFSEESSTVREGYIVSSLQKGFRSLLDRDVLDLVSGERMPEGETGTFEDPTIAVAYAIVPSGSLYTNEANTRGYVGIEVAFLVSMHVPGQNPHLFSVQVTPPEPVTVQAGGIALKPSDYLVYDVMAKLAFEKLESKLAYAFFGERAAD